MPQRLKLLILSLLGLAVLALGGFTWWYSDQIIVPSRTVSFAPDLTVIAAHDSVVVLPATEETAKPGIWFMQSEEGWGRVDTVIRADEERVERAYHHFVGVPPRAGTRVDLDPLADAATPRTAAGLDFQDIEIRRDGGRYPAWYVKGTGATWAIFVHGMSVSRAESLRLLPVLHDLGLPCLVITYSNDSGASPSPDGFQHLGAEEWRELESAADYALRSGAEDLLLVGYSTGCQIAYSFLRKSDLAKNVRGIVFDAPVLDWNATFAYYARTHGIPFFLPPMAATLATLRAKIWWRDLEQVRYAGRLRAPVLLFHGAEDDIVPLSTSRALKRMVPHLVTLIIVPGAGHVESWNVDPERYEATVRDWLARNWLPRV